jgi:catalase-peroxidase
MGPVSRYLNPLVPKEPQLWQDPIPPVDHELVNENDIYILKEKISKSGLSVSDLIKTAWGSAATYRGTDRRGKANGSQTSRLY